MVVLSAVISVLLIAAVVAACWWLAHNVDYADDVDLPYRVCGRCLLDGIEYPTIGDQATRAPRCGRRICSPEDRVIENRPSRRIESGRPPFTEWTPSSVADVSADVEVVSPE
ncbi:hypothetical protein [Nocardia transvalensis]|uniref:hypothetical protein n=1 Tax=Nocardia transvalensis TaxID=37333 RepID=UPI001894C3DC|nr:hypothetical protein [Nocardia transvalensis]MBF6333059.1 hypothetical protein [Nocardia transvalensis]